MPDEDSLSTMYGSDYGNAFFRDSIANDPKESRFVIDWLKKLGTGVFVDYGCGSGDLLVQASEQHWETVGVELNAAVSAEVESRTGQEVLTPTLAFDRAAFADVLHLGDVIEHLTNPNCVMPRILRILKPGGMLLAQGPLEANANLFTTVLKLSKAVRRSRHPAGMPPYHVVLATANGQRKFFERFCLDEVFFGVHEVAWPAPAHLSLCEIRHPRLIGLFVLRRISQTLSVLRPQKWGNRYLYAGHWHG
jgi:SAM-dependent methyltransferase